MCHNSFDADYFRAHLPHSIEAVFYLHGACDDIGDDNNHNAACEQYARAAHANMLRHFRLPQGRLPLLRLDPFNWDIPLTDDRMNGWTAPPAKAPSSPPADG